MRGSNSILMMDLRDNGKQDAKKTLCFTYFLQKQALPTGTQMYLSALQGIAPMTPGSSLERELRKRNRLRL